MLEPLLQVWCWPPWPASLLLAVAVQAVALVCAAAGSALALVHALYHPLDYWLAGDAEEHCDGLRWRSDEQHAVPLLGSFADSLLGNTTFSDDLAALRRRHADAAAVGAFEWRARPCVLLSDARLVGRVLGPDAPAFDAEVLPASVDAGVDAKMDAKMAAAPRVLRERLSPLLRAGRVDAVARLMADCADQLVQLLDERVAASGQGHGAVLEVLGPLRRFSTAVVGACAFGVACNCIQDPDWELHRVAEASRRPGAASMLALAVVTAVPSAATLLPPRLLYPSAACFYVDMLRETAAFRERTRTRRRDFVDLMMAVTAPVDAPTTASSRPASRCSSRGFLTEKDRRNHCALAYDVVAAQAFVLHAHAARVVARGLVELARQPELQHRVAQEVNAAMVHDDASPSARVLGLQVLQDSPLLEKVLSETLRLEPACDVLARAVADRGYTLPVRRGADRGVPLSPGTRVYVAVRDVHRDPQHYPDPLRFAPEERFSAEARRARPAGAYIPFGELPPHDAHLNGLPSPSGSPPPAHSTSARFALQEMWLCLAALVVNLEFSLDTSGSPADDDELWLRVQRRSRKPVDTVL